METFNSRDDKPLPTRHTVEVLALRPNPERNAAEWRTSLPALLAGIVGEIAGGELELSMFADDDGMVRIALGVAAGEASALVAAELAAAVAPIAETAVRAESADDRAQWPVVADAPASRLGFTAGAAAPSLKSISWRCGDGVPTLQLIEEFASMPGHGVRIRLRAAQLGGETRWEVQLRVGTTGGLPSLRSRVTIRNRFVGLQIAETQREPAVWLQLAPDDLPAVFGFPVAGSEPLPGVHLTAPAPIATTPPRRGASGDEAGLRIGCGVTGAGRPVPVELTDAERLRHVHVLGRTGTGKSSALAGIAHGLTERGEGALIADPHGQLCERILAELPDDVCERVWVIRCGDVDNPVPLNPLAETDPVRRDIAIAEVGAAFQYLFDQKETGIVGPRFHERVGMTLRALTAAHGHRASLLDVPFASTDENFMTAAVQMSDDDRLKIWWRTNQLEKRSDEHGQVIAWVNSKFQAFSNTAAMRAILGSGANAIDFADAMDDGRIILLDLSKAELGEPASRLLGYLYLGRVWEAALRRKRFDRPFTVMVDEAHTLIAGALTNMLAEGRKFGLSVVLAHQYLDQLDHDLRPAVDGNVATTIAFRSAVSDAIEVRKRFGGLVDASMLMMLPDLTAITLRTAMAGFARPHTLVIDHNQLVLGRTGAELEAHARMVYGLTRAALVDPHRDATAAAARGVSNIEVLPLCSPPRPPLPASPTGTGDGSRRGGRAALRQSSPFLDEWLAKRQHGGVAHASDAD